MSRPKFELICKGDGGTSQVFTLKNVSSVIASNIQAESFELIFHDRERQNLMTAGIVLPTSLGPNEMKEFVCPHPALQHRGVGYNTIQLVFTVEDEQSNQFECIATKNVEEARRYLLGPWDIKVEPLRPIEEDNQERPIDVSLPHEFISACTKIADNPVSYASFDEDGLFLCFWLFLYFRVNLRPRCGIRNLYLQAILRDKGLSPKCPFDMIRDSLRDTLKGQLSSHTHR